jgi:hypothetical protein
MEADVKLQAGSRITKAFNPQKSLSNRKSKHGISKLISCIIKQNEMSRLKFCILLT